MKKIITGLLSWAIILAAVTIVGLRLAFLNIDFFKTEIEAWLAEDTIPGISFAAIKGDWRMLNPVLRLENASITLPDKSQPLVVSDMRIEFSVWRSLQLRAPTVLEISGSLDSVTIRKDLEQYWWLNDIRLNRSGDDSQETPVEEVIAAIPDYLRIDLQQLVIEDEIHNRRYSIEQVRADIQRRHESVLMQLSADFPESLGQQFSLKAIIKNPESVVYLKGSGFKVEPLASLFNFDSGAVKAAELNGEIWLNFSFDNEDQVSINSDFSFSDGLLKADPGKTPVEFALDTQIEAYRYNGLWHVRNHFEHIFIDGTLVNAFDTQLKADLGKQNPRLDGWLDKFGLSALALLKENLTGSESSWLAEPGAIDGRLDEIWFSLDLNNLNNVSAMADIVDLSTRSAGLLPGIKQLNGSLTIGNQRASIAVGGTALELDFANQFRAPLRFTRYEVSANAILDGNNIRISVPHFSAGNSDINLAGRLWLKTDQSDTPFLYLRANFDEGDAHNTSKYLPVEILPKATLVWLDNGIKAADIFDGNLLFHGRLNNILELDEDSAGEFFVGFDIANAKVLFSPQWAAAENATGRVTFHNMSMEIDLDSASFSAIDNVQGQVTINNLYNAAVDLNLTVQAPMEKALPVWFTTPIGRDMQAVGNELKNPQGSVDLSLAVSIPVANPDENATADVGLTFVDAAIDAPDWGMELSAIRGKLHITEDDVSARGINAFYFKDAVKVDVSTDKAADETLISARGVVDSQRVLNILPDYLSRRFEGSSNWSARFAIDNSRQNQSKPRLRINTASLLNGTSILFPHPLAKSARDEKKLTSEIAIFADDRIDFNVSYGPEVSMRGRLEPDVDEMPQLSTLDIGLSSRFSSPMEKGLHLKGTLSELPLGDWLALHRSESKSDNQLSANRIEMIESVDLLVENVTLFQQTLIHNEFHLSKSVNGLTGSIVSSGVKGDIDIPYNLSPERPVIADLEYIRLLSGESDSKVSGLFPDDFFNVRLNTQEFSYDDVRLSDFQLALFQQGDNLTIESLRFRHNEIYVSTDAEWHYTPGMDVHQSTFNMKVEGENLGESLKGIGYGDVMKDGAVTFDSHFNWDSELFHPDWNSLTGSATVDIRNGMLKDVDPGSGKLIGLLSLNALPRRFALDFDDFFLQGLEFDRISGDYKISGEELYTSNTKLEGSSVGMNLTGITRLRQRSYEQELVVTPKIRQTLPLIGGLTAGSGVGWGLLILQNLFKKVIDRSVAIQYRISGSWEDPRIDLVNATNDKGEIIEIVR